MNEAAPNLFEQPEEEVRSIAPRNPALRMAFDVGLGALIGAGLAAHIFTAAWGLNYGEQDWFSFDQRFAAIVGAAGIFGLMAYTVALPRFWREARMRITPWIAMGLAMWFAAEWSMRLYPSTTPDHFVDPRFSIPPFAVFAEIGLFAVAALAFIDWRINHEEKIEVEKLNG
jgi:hypothetical protein